MQRIIKICMLLVAVLQPAASFAQLTSHPDKFLGNITTRGNVEAGGGLPKFYELWNQITCENESKWQSVEGNARGTFNWGCDNAFKYAKQHNFTYKFHALVWGSQYPSWIESLSYSDRYASIVEWYDAVQQKYPDLPMIDVVNEAIDGHQGGTHFMKEALGGGGKTGYDWLIKAFEMAYERWPNTILIYNDFNTFQWNTDQFIDLVRTLRDAGAPVDAYGCQSHDLTDCDVNKFKQSEKKLQDALLMPMYSTEYDIGTDNDALQLQRYKEQIPYMWEKPYCAGITLWGYVYGATWTTNGNSGIYKDGAERPAMTWLKEYMASDDAKNAVSPFPGMKKEASIYIRPAALKVARGDVLPIYIRASMATKTIEKIDLYIEDELIATMTEAPYRTEYEVPTSITSGWKTIKAVVTTTDGSTYERYSRFTSLASTKKRAPYNETVPQLPGTINITEFDEGASGVTYYNASRDNSAMKDGQWMDYTVDVAESGLYSFEAEVASTKKGGIFHVAEYAEDNLNFLTEFVEVPKTASASDYKLLHGKILMPLTAGRHVFTLLVDKGGFYIKNITLNHYEEGEGTCMVKAFNTEYGVGDYIPVSVKATTKNSTISQVNVYANNLYVGTATESPYTVEFVPTEMDTYSITAIAIDAEGREKWSKVRELKVTSPTQTAIRTIKNDTPEVTDAPTYNLMGVPVGPDYRGIVIKNGKKIIVK